MLVASPSVGSAGESKDPVHFRDSTMPHLPPASERTGGRSRPMLTLDEVYQEAIWSRPLSPTRSPSRIDAPRSTPPVNSRVYKFTRKAMGGPVFPG